MKVKQIAVSALPVIFLSLQSSPVGATPFGGCVSSPENPTLLLAMLGAAAVGLPKLRRRLRTKRGV